MKNAFVNSVTNDLSKSKKDGLTHNGAVTRKTSGQKHLDLFAIIGAARNSVSDAVKLFSKAYAEDKELALRIALWARDVRGGSGERKVFREIFRHLSENDPIIAQKLTPFVPDYGRWDDVIECVDINSYTFKVAAENLHKAIESGNSLAAKWTPRKGAIAVKLREIWNLSPKQYRKFLVSHTNVVETKMCYKQWDNIDFGKLPSLASLRYQKAFGKNAPTKYANYKQALVKGEAKINVSTLYPHDIITNIRYGTADTQVLNAQWDNLPDYLGDRSGKVLCEVDVSSSMTWVTIGGGRTQPLDVACGLGMYVAERLKGPFKDLFMTFSTSPSFVKLQGNTVSERFNNMQRANVGGSTDIQAAFKLILDTALKHNVPASDMPETIIILSDMEFNICVSNGKNKTNFGGFKDQYENAGYKLPQIVFWNLNARADNNPVKYDENGTCMVSGYSPAILESILTGESFDPMKVMFKTVGKERYDVASLVVE